MNNKKNNINFDFLGDEYQDRLICLILTDFDFAKTILPHLKPEYFTIQTLKEIFHEIHIVFETEEVILDSPSLMIRINGKYKDNEAKKDLLNAYIQNIRNIKVIDYENIKSRAIDFCKSMSLMGLIDSMSKEAKRGNFEGLLGFEDDIAKTLNIGKSIRNEVSNFDNIDQLLSEDYRLPIPTGVEELDIKLNGGVARGELAICIAPLGVGKTTFSTVICNTAYNLGYNVLQICFEDTNDQIQRKHMCRWTGMDEDEMMVNKELVKKIVLEKTTASRGNLIIKRMSSIDTTMKTIKNYVKDLNKKGIKIDMMVIDYIDCVQPSKSYQDNNIAEGMIMREYESMLSELNIAGWAMTQSNRSGINSEIVNTDQMGGSIKKAQIGHIIVSIARTMDQKTENKATVTLLKSRVGPDGIVWKDVIFENRKLKIEIPSNVDVVGEFISPSQIMPVQNTDIDSILNNLNIGN